MHVDPAGAGTAPARFRHIANWRKPGRVVEPQAALSPDRPRRYKDFRARALAIIEQDVARTVFQRARYKKVLRQLRFDANQSEHERLFREASAKGGRPSNLRASALALLSAYVYLYLTGKKPVRINDTCSKDSVESGPFYKFLKAIFLAVGVRQNVDHYLRPVVKYKWRPFLKVTEVNSINSEALRIQNFYLIYSRQKSDATSESFSNLPFAHDPVAFRRGPEPRSPQPSPS